MIARISGILIESSLTDIIVEVNGISYRLNVPLSTIDKLPALGEKITLNTHLHVREDAMLLYGFMSNDELTLFKLLLNYVQGIGPKLALNVLSTLSVSNFCTAISSKDLKMLSKVNGVGKKTAERMVIELHDKIDRLGALATASVTTEHLNDEASDAVDALETLGYKKDRAIKTVQKILNDNAEKKLSASDLIRKALSHLNQ